MTTETVRVWDLPVRIFHWSLVLFFLTAYITGEEESSIHVYSGYIVIGLVAFRILWGFVGSNYARFSEFLYSPATVLEYLQSLVRREPRHYLGHNPAGGWMIVALLTSLLITGYSGLKLYGLEGHGPLAGAAEVVSVIPAAYADRGEYENDNETAEEWWEEFHELFANLTLVLVLFHLGGVVVSSLAHRENLVKAMFTGRKKLR